jgi:transcriptional regulator with XRE-family HTH domain
MYPQHSDAGWAAELGSQLRTVRLRLELDQRQLAARAGVGLNAVKNLESGKGATVRSLVRVLRALDRTDWISALAPQVTVSPLQVLRARRPRQRAARKRPRPGKADV